jgi:hypothetical protein
MGLEGLREVEIGKQDEHGMYSVECDMEDRDGLDAAIAKKVSAEWSLHHLERRQPTLENIFLRYVQDAPTELDS